MSAVFAPSPISPWLSVVAGERDLDRAQRDHLVDGTAAQRGD
jgi:hypothetical protein